MTVWGQVALGIYAALLVAGGVIGFVKAGSRPSLIAGTISGVVALIALGLSIYQPLAGFGLGLALAAGLFAMFAGRYGKGRKFMPAGLLALVSLGMIGLLAILVGSPGLR
jgi:uncharacterized membrane protein (UPF0136 family)